jgi:DNA-binding NarL/FixJ family response regulator
MKFLPASVQLLIASEFDIFRKGIKSILEKSNDAAVVFEAAHVNELFNCLQNNRIDIILLNMNIESELLQSLCQNIHSKHPNLPILIFMEGSTHISLAELIINGVRGVIWKENSGDNLMEIIRCVASGSLYFENPENCKLNCQLSKTTCDNLSKIVSNNKLSDREIEIVKWIAKGLSYSEIADLLCISARTVETHKYNVLSKLGLKNKSELIRYAIEKFDF